MELLQPYYQYFVWIIVIAGLTCALSPIFISEARKSSTLSFYATVMCITSIIGGVFSMAAGGILGATLGVGLFGTLWAASLIVGVAAHISSSVSRDMKEAAFRLLHNESEGLVQPKNVSTRSQPRL